VLLVDTSVWVEHLRRGFPALAARLELGEVLGHPFVLGELALGRLRQRGEILDLLRRLPQAVVAGDEEVMKLIGRQGLDGSGLGWVDAHLVASALLSRARIWTLDRRLATVGRQLNLLAQLPTGG